MRHLVLLLLLLRLPAVAQENAAMMDVIFLEGGSVLKGRILEWTGDTLTIQLLAGSEMRIPSGAVLRAEQRPNIQNARILLERKKAPYATAGMVLVANSERTSLMLDASGGYRFDPRLAVGVGAGIIQYAFFEEVFYPLFLEWRARWSDKSIVPYSVTRFGVSHVAWNDADGFFGPVEIRDYETPFLYQFSLGWRLWQREKIHLATELGYLHQRADYHYTFIFDNDSQEGEVSRSFRRISIRFLIGF